MKKQRHPYCFTLLYKPRRFILAKYVIKSYEYQPLTLAKRKRRQKANEDPHASWYWLVTVKLFWCDRPVDIYWQNTSQNHMNITLAFECHLQC